MTMRIVIALLLSTAPCAHCLATEPTDSGSDPKFSFEEHLIMDGYGYAYGLAAADLDGDGDTDLTSGDAVGGCMYWFENPGRPDGGDWVKHRIDDDLPESRTMCVADFNRDGHPDLLANGSAKDPTRASPATQEVRSQRSAVRNFSGDCIIAPSI